MKKKRTNFSLSNLPLPSDEKIATLAALLEKQIRNEEVKDRYASVKQVLAFLGTGTLLSLTLIFPTALVLAKPFLDEQRRKDYESWKCFNPSYLRRTIKRLKQEKVVELEEKDGEQIVKLTKRGKRRILRYSLEELSIEKPATWDGYWRLILYDVSDKRKVLRDLFRQTLRTLGFFQLQESVWLYPYPCEHQISFLREYYGVGNEVVYVVANKLEDDAPYKTYFGV